MRPLIMLVLATLLMFAAPPPKKGPQSDEFFEGDGNVGIVNDYLFRGETKTNHLPAVQGALDVALGNAYLGVFGTNVNIMDSSNATATSEFDAFVGFRGRAFWNWGYSIGYIKYIYPDIWSLTQQEAYLALGYANNDAQFSFSTWGYYNLDTQALVYEGRVRWGYNPLGISLRVGNKNTNSAYGSAYLHWVNSILDISVGYEVYMLDMYGTQMTRYVIYRVGKSF